ncbi:replication-associated recombination protein A, partial [Burkholderia multivorans]
LMLTLRPLGDDDISTLLDRAMVSERGLAGEFELDAEAKDFIVRIAGADARRSLTILEAAAGIAAAQAGERGDGLGDDVTDGAESADDEAAEAVSTEGRGGDVVDDESADGEGSPIRITVEAASEASSEAV